jgi:hypothetical protein
VEEVLSAAKLGFFDVDLTDARISYDTISRRRLDESKLKDIRRSMTRQGIQKYQSPIVILADESKILNLAAVQPDCSALATLHSSPDAKDLECISGMHRLAALTQIRTELEREIMELKRSSPEDDADLERKRSQLSNYYSWPALLYRRGEFLHWKLMLMTVLTAQLLNRAHHWACQRATQSRGH